MPIPSSQKHKKKRSKFKRTPISQQAAHDIREGSNTTDTDDEDKILGLISRIAPDEDSTKERVVSQKTKKAATSGLFSDNSEGEQLDAPSDDGENFHIEKEIADTRKKPRISSKKRRSRLSLDDDADPAQKDTPTSSKSPKLKQTPRKVRKTLNRSDVSSGSRDHDVSITSCPDGRVDLMMDASTNQNDGKNQTSKLVAVPSAEESLKFKLEPNDMVALKPDGKWHDRPLLGKVVTLTKDSVNIVWYTGSYTGKWYKWSAGPTKSYHHEIDRDRVLMDGFQLKPSNKLSVKIAKHLKQLYTIIDNN